MNFSAVRGYNAYAQFTATIKDAARQRETTQEQSIKQDKTGSLIGDPVDTVMLSRTARSRSLSIAAEREPAQTALREWIKESGPLKSELSLSTSGQTMTQLLSSNGISLEENESYDINIDVWCAVTVTGKNAEKAKAIQNLLNTTPSGINWGLILQQLPPDR